MCSCFYGEKITYTTRFIGVILVQYDASFASYNHIKNDTSYIFKAVKGQILAEKSPFHHQLAI